MTDQPIDVSKYINAETVLADLAKEARRLAEIVALEASGVRDGDGTWHGSDGLDYALDEIEPRVHALVGLLLEVRGSDFADPDAIPY